MEQYKKSVTKRYFEIIPVFSECACPNCFLILNLFFLISCIDGLNKDSIYYLQNILLKIFIFDDYDFLKFYNDGTKYLEDHRLYEIYDLLTCKNGIQNSINKYYDAHSLNGSSTNNKMDGLSNNNKTDDEFKKCLIDLRNSNKNFLNLYEKMKKDKGIYNSILTNVIKHENSIVLQDKKFNELDKSPNLLLNTDYKIFKSYVNKKLGSEPIYNLLNYIELNSKKENIGDILKLKQNIEYHIENNRNLIIQYFSFSKCDFCNNRLHPINLCPSKHCKMICLKRNKMKNCDKCEYLIKNKIDQNCDLIHCNFCYHNHETKNCKKHCFKICLKKKINYCKICLNTDEKDKICNMFHCNNCGFHHLTSNCRIK